MGFAPTASNLQGWPHATWVLWQSSTKITQRAAVIVPFSGVILPQELDQLGEFIHFRCDKTSLIRPLVLSSCSAHIRRFQYIDPPVGSFAYQTRRVKVSRALTLPPSRIRLSHSLFRGNGQR